VQPVQLGKLPPLAPITLHRLRMHQRDMRQKSISVCGQCHHVFPCDAWLALSEVERLYVDNARLRAQVAAQGEIVRRARTLRQIAGNFNKHRATCDEQVVEPCETCNALREVGSDAELELDMALLEFARLDAATAAEA
jgi:hypothetical protein